MIKNIKLKEVSKLITKGTTPTTVGGRFVSSGINFIKSESVSGAKYLNNEIYEHIDVETDEKLKRSRLKADDLLFSIAGAYLGKIAIVRDNDLPANTNQAVAIVRLDKNKVDVDFLYYYFSQIHINKYINKLSSQSSQPNLNLDLLGKLEFEYKDLQTQQKIAAVLSSLDAKIETNNRINTELEAMAKTLYDYWFVQFDFPDANGKPYKTSGGKMVYSNEVKRDIPEGWKVQPLFKAMDVQYGFPFDTSKFTDDTTQKPVIRIRDILENTISTYSTEEVQDKYKLNSKDLLIGMDGNFHLNFWDKDGAYLNQRSVRIRSILNSEISNFQAYFELEPHIKAREKNVSRTTVGHLSDKDLKRLFLVSATKNKNFNPKETFDAMLEKIISNRIQNQELTNLRDWLLPMLMNGQVTVEDAIEQLGMVAEERAEYK